MEYLTLLNGPTLPAPEIDLALRLEAQGLELIAEPTSEGPHLRLHNPRGGPPAVSPADVEEIRTWKAHLLALVAYVNRVSATATRNTCATPWAQRKNTRKKH